MSATPQRIQIERSKGWKKPEGTVNITRPGPFGNPYRVGDLVTISGLRADDHQGFALPFKLTAQQAVEMFRAEMLGRLLIPRPPDDDRPTPADLEYQAAVLNHRLAMELLDQVRGHDVACACRVENVCHGDVWLELANMRPTDLQRLARRAADQRAA